MTSTIESLTENCDKQIAEPFESQEKQNNCLTKTKFLKKKKKILEYERMFGNRSKFI